VEPDTTLRTGREWPGVWTRDVSYSILLSMAYMQPEATRCSLMRKVDSLGRIIQDTGSGGAWPVSSDRMIWALAAFELYKVEGDRAWLEYIYPIIKRSLATDEQVVNLDPTGLTRGETSFIDWREQSYPRWMQTADIYQSHALSTTVVHASAYNVLAEIAQILGYKAETQQFSARAAALAEAVNRDLWLEDLGYYAMYDYGREYLVLNPRAESLGLSLAILNGVAPADRARRITESTPITPFGVGVFYPQISDMTPYHNNALWPWVASYWALANAKVGNEQGCLEAIGSVFRPAALFCTNKENLVLDNGDIATELNSSNMLWCLAGNIAITHKILFGIEFTANSLNFHPFVPANLAAERSLTGFKYRNATLDITVRGAGSRIASFTLDGREHEPSLASNIKGHHTIVITMDDQPIAPLVVNHQRNAKTPVTPIARIEGNVLTWRPVENGTFPDFSTYHYEIIRNGERIARTNSTTFDATVPGVYQVVAVVAPGIESFASEPVDNLPTFTFEFPGESTMMTSQEVSYQPFTIISGYTGNGFVETDRTTKAIDLDIYVPEDGRYSIALIYANGNGPVNTENKCAVRHIAVDNARVGTLVMPQRGVGNWSEWGSSSVVTADIKAGSHRLQILFDSDCENMNIATNHALIDRVVLRKL
ncbi:MAG: MGH1-like glycoside hydrolase domain-containing protein, partial [Muribaculaceae bacterium]